MNRVLFPITLLAIAASFATAQNNNALPPVTFKGNTANTSSAPSHQHNGPSAPFCPPSSCLYYAGDFDSNNSNADALFNADFTGAEEEGQAWVGVRPDRDVTVTGGTFVEILLAGFVGTNPTPFSVQIGIKPGQAGKTICNTSGNATFAFYGNGQPPPSSYTIKKLSKSCKLKKGEVYYINLLPTSSSGYGYVVNVIDAKPQNHYGWKNDLNDCYFNGAVFGANYDPCDSEGYFAELSIALTGKKSK